MTRAGTLRSLGGKVAVVTGAAAGIGRAIAERFARDGMRVVLADIDGEALDRAVAGLRAGGADVRGVVTDVAQLDAVAELARATLAAFGAVHVVCNNAGVTRHTGQAMWELTDNDWNWLLGVNVKGVVNGVRVFVPVLLEQGEPAHIVNTGSIAGLVVGGGAYGVTKHAVVSLSENLYVELARRTDRIGVSCLCPGLVATDTVFAERHRPPELRNAAPDTAEQIAFRDMIDGRVRSGDPPSVIADLVAEGICTDRFYLCTEDPAEYIPRDERVRRRLENILACRHPEPLHRR